MISTQEKEPTPSHQKEQAERVQQMERIIAPLRVPLPAGYKFNREEANER